jgi:hypothetical protein
LNKQCARSNNRIGSLNAKLSSNSILKYSSMRNILSRKISGNPRIRQAQASVNLMHKANSILRCQIKV